MVEEQEDCCWHSSKVGTIFEGSRLGRVLRQIRPPGRANRDLIRVRIVQRFFIHKDKAVRLF